MKTNFFRWFHTAAAAAKSLQSYPTLYNPIDCSPPGSPVPGILQARTLDWVAISSSNAWKWKVKGKLLSRVQLLATPWTTAHQAPPSMGSSRQEYWSGVPLPSLDFTLTYFKSPFHQFLSALLSVFWVTEQKDTEWLHQWSCSVMSNSLRSHGLYPTRLLHPWDFPGKSTGVGCHCFLRELPYQLVNSLPLTVRKPKMNRYPRTAIIMDHRYPKQTDKSSLEEREFQKKTGFLMGTKGWWTGPGCLFPPFPHQD